MGAHSAENGKSNNLEFTVQTMGGMAGPQLEPDPKRVERFQGIVIQFGYEAERSH